MAATTPPTPPPAWWDPPDWWRTKAPKWQETGPYKTTPQDYFQQALYNKLVPYLDPLTQLSTAQWLSRDNPYSWRTYSPALLPNMATQNPLETRDVQSFLTPDRFNSLLKQLNYSKLVNSLPDAKLRKMFNDPNIKNRSTAAADARAGLDWLTEALSTAKTAGPGATRKQQALAKGHLATLYKEAGQEPQRGGMYRTLFENLVNPVVTRAPLSGVFGTMRSIVPAPDRGNAQVSKNPFLT